YTTLEHLSQPALDAAGAQFCSGVIGLRHASILCRPRVSDLTPNLAKELRNRFRAGNDGKEVCVECPSRNNVLMQVGSNSGACDLSLVHSKVKTVTHSIGSQHPHCRLSEARNFRCFFFGGIVIQRNMAVWAH